MIHVRVDGTQLNPLPTKTLSVEIAALTRVIGPSEILVGTVAPTKLADLSTTNGGIGAQVVIANLAAFTIFWCYGTPTAPALTTANGVPLPSNAFLTLDAIGGLCIWAISGTAQSAGSGTRITGGDQT
jgi:hypothetical protein